MKVVNMKAWTLARYAVKRCLVGSLVRKLCLQKVLIIHFLVPLRMSAYACPWDALVETHINQLHGYLNYRINGKTFLSTQWQSNNSSLKVSPPNLESLLRRQKEINYQIAFDKLENEQRIISAYFIIVWLFEPSHLEKTSQSKRKLRTMDW